MPADLPPVDILEWSRMTGPQVQSLDRANTIVYVSSSPLEVHGPHLPTITDVAEADALFRRMAARFAARRAAEGGPPLTFVMLPPIYVAADVLPHVGSLAFRSSTIRRVFEDLGRSLAAQGFRHIWVGGFHGGPRHFVPVEQACDQVSRRHGVRMIGLFSVLLGALTGGRTDLADVLSHLPGVTREDLEGDAHGGLVETSMMLAIQPQDVQPVYRELPGNTVDLWLISRGEAPLRMEEKGRPSLAAVLRSLKEKLLYYAHQTWSGNPSLADPALGDRILDELADRSVAALWPLFTGERPLTSARSPVWKLRWIFSARWVSWAFERALGYRSRVW
jgi:creatinine amidohydrolase